MCMWYVVCVWCICGMCIFCVLCDVWCVCVFLINSGLFVLFAYLFSRKAVELRLVGCDALTDRGKETMLRIYYMKNIS